ncbi:restriction endonuclease [Paenibacillus sp. P96]|uniref:Restriction endonuclease n=1 Tax=Paenibacillus zeirhizosphaerae TaxID=2987519 RepID=A0ABT9FU84_9BACL|nr:restriction endonuclease [Paenibacillus sp. P96]MDP4098265.1 restriction endonuclease [Paenibacillus sp. P96]
MDILHTSLGSITVWIIGLLILVALAAGWVRRRGARVLRELNPRKITLKDIDRMEDGSEFETYLHRLLTALGYEEVYKTTGSRDFGADLVFTDRSGLRNVVQAKRYGMQSPVGLGAVQEIYASMNYYRAHKSIVITSGRYTDSCATLAAANGVILLDREDLEDIITFYKGRRSEEAMNIIEREAEPFRGGWNEDKLHKRAENI